MLAKLFDFYLGDESPFVITPAAEPHHRPKRVRMGDKFTLPNLDNMVALVALLAQSCSLPDDPETSPWSLPQQVPPLTMSPEEHQMVIHPVFVSALLKEQLNVNALSDLLQHYCWESGTRSSSALHTVLQGIDTMDSEALDPYLRVFMDLVQLADSRQSWRTDAAMGRLLRVIANNMRYKQATLSCLRMVIQLTQNPVIRRWLFQHQSAWLHDWLLYGLSEAVRKKTEELCYHLIAAEPDETDEAGRPVPAAVLVALHDQLISMLPVVSNLAREMGPDQSKGGNTFADEPPIPRFAPFFKVCAYCARAMPTVPVDELLTAYTVIDLHHWECDETKKELLGYWYAAAIAPQPATGGALALAATHLRRLLDSFVSLRPNSRALEYNREVLPYFYGLMKLVVEGPDGATCLQVLLNHRNWEWAIKYLLVESQDYTQLGSGIETDRLGPTLMWLLKECGGTATFRQKILTAALSANKLPAHAKNIVVLLSSYIITDEDKVPFTPPEAKPLPAPAPPLTTRHAARRPTIHPSQPPTPPDDGRRRWRATWRRCPSWPLASRVLRASLCWRVGNGTTWRTCCGCSTLWATGSRR